MIRTTLLPIAALPFLLMGCAATTSSKELLDARIVVARASESPASKFAPEDLLEARQLLAQAEGADDGSKTEVQYAYLADREARRAESRGIMLHNQEQKEKAYAEFASLQESGRLSAEDSLDKSRSDQERLKGNLNTSAAALSASEKARKDADARAAAAIASLTTLANVREEGSETIITLSGQVLFTTGQSTLLPIAKDSLTRVAKALQDISTDRRIVVKGHTDSQGEDAANQQLSEKRANAVMSYLTSQGIAATRLSAVGRGEAEPVAPNDTPEGRANNRRVELVIAASSAAAAR